jgi:hypothetical protein
LYRNGCKRKKHSRIKIKNRKVLNINKWILCSKDKGIDKDKDKDKDHIINKESTNLIINK